jgi:hypothetical protein
MNSTKGTNVKMYAAVIGGSAVVALGALSTAVMQQQSGPQQLATGPTVGAVTSTTPAPAGLVEESVMKAAPTIKVTQTVAR